MAQAGRISGGAAVVSTLTVGQGPASSDPTGEAELLAAFGSKIASIQEQVAAEHAAQAQATQGAQIAPLAVGAPLLAVGGGPLDAPSAPEEGRARTRAPEQGTLPVSGRPLAVVPMLLLLTELGTRYAELERTQALNTSGQLVLSNQERNALAALLDLPALTRGAELVAAVSRAVSIDAGGVTFPLTPAEREELERRAKLAGMDFQVWLAAVIERLKPHILSGSAG